MSYDVAQCVAIRDYGTEAKPLKLVLKPSPNGTVMRILVLRKGGSADTEQVPVTLSLGAHREFTNLLRYRDAKSGFGILAINLPMEMFKANLAAVSLRVEGGGVDDSFTLSQLPPVVAELDKCVADLQEFWNIGAAYKSRIASYGEPKQPLRALFSSHDYPVGAMLSHQEGSVKLTFLVDERGQVADCSVDETSGIAVLDTMSCYVISKRAQFTPAMGTNGKPVKSAYSQRINWRLGA
ncbi:MAG: energy transducer TonB [Sphingomonas sp.]